MALIERRVRSGRYEWRCSCGRWYALIAQHIHRFHRANCTCAATCLPAIRRGTVRPRGYLR